jgi:hypothetical protein
VLDDARDLRQRIVRKVDRGQDELAALHATAKCVTPASRFSQRAIVSTRRASSAGACLPYGSAPASDQ